MGVSFVRVVAALLAAGFGLAGFVLLSGPAVAQKGKVTVEKVEYRGWKNNLRLSNGQAELIVTLDVGPRIISYRLEGGTNVFKNYDEQMGQTGEKEWQIRGGHRLWVGPEDLTRTYSPDNGPVQYKDLENGGVRFTAAPDTEYGIQKEIDVFLAPTGTDVRLVHRITNIAKEVTELAPWALTVMSPGGIEVIPLPIKKPHPGPPKNANSPKDYAANQNMAIWPFFDFKDSRWSFGSRYIMLRQDPNKGPTKIGLAHQMNWVGYVNGGNFFMKRITYEEGKTYPDNGSNFETFTNQDMLEIESLGPIVRLGPSESVELKESWFLRDQVPDFKDESEIDKSLRRMKTAKVRTDTDKPEP